MKEWKTKEMIKTGEEYAQVGKSLSHLIHQITIRCDAGMYESNARIVTIELWRIKEKGQEWSEIQKKSIRKEEKIKSKRAKKLLKCRRIWWLVSTRAQIREQHTSLLPAGSSKDSYET